MLIINYFTCFIHLKMFRNCLNHKKIIYTIGLIGLSSTYGFKQLYYYYQKKKEEKCMAIDPLWRSRLGKKLQEEVLIFSGSANIPLAEEVAKGLGTKLSQIQRNRFADGEYDIRIQERIRGKEIFLIQPTGPPVNENLMELLLMISAMKRSSVTRITAIIPYYGYCRSDRKMMSRVPIAAADVAKLLETLGVDRVIAVDLHSGQIQGFFGPSIPVDNLESQILMVDYLLKSNLVNDYNKLLIVSPDTGGVYRTKEFADHVNMKTGGNTGITMIVKHRMRPNEVSKMELVGKVEGNDCIIIDDMIDTGGTLSLAAKTLKENGARHVYAFATHGLFSGKGIDIINNSELDKVIVTNTIPPNPNKKSAKIEYISIGILISEAIRRIQNQESLSEMFSKKI